MAINIQRAARKTDDFLIPKRTTSEGVAPGTYSNTHNEPAPVPPESVVPFSSLQEKILNPIQGTAGITPGPGTYVGQKVLNSHGHKANGEQTFGLAAVAFKSGARRFAPTAPGSTEFTPSTIEANPGPGTYTLEGSTPRPKPMLRGPAKPVLEAIEKTPSSMPPTKLLPGQQAETEAGKADVANLCMRHTGEPADMVGPGEYDPRGEDLTQRRMPQTMIHSAVKPCRNLWEPTVDINCSMPPKENPGPGAYEPTPGMADMPQAAEGEPINTFQFSSRSPLSYQIEVKEEKVIPGPGQYEVVAELERQAKTLRERSAAQGDRVRFGSVTDRVGWFRPVTQPFTDPYFVHNVPGPGHYVSSASSSFPDEKRRKEAERVLPNASKKKLHGVHHPTIIMALQESQGPLQAFNSSDERPCNKPAEQRTPAPWQYNKEVFSGESMSATLRERAKIGRRGAFGSCTDRFFRSPLLGRAGLPELGGGAEADKGTGANSEPRSAFASQSPRFRQQAGPREVFCNKLGAAETPAPGAYVVEKEPNYRSPFRHPRRDHLSFGSCKSRFEATQALVDREAALKPGPGEYELPRPPRPVGAAKLQDKRRDMRVGCTSETVGPGSYSGSLESTMLKKTYNVTTQAAWSPPQPPSPRRGALMSGNSGSF